ncbi:hypothetical protein MUK42_23282, partial [Musa troglodytarum]
MFLIRLFNTLTCTSQVLLRFPQSLCCHEDIIARVRSRIRDADTMIDPSRPECMTGTDVHVLRNQPVAAGAPAASASSRKGCSNARGACCRPGEDGSVLPPSDALRGVVDGDGTEGKKKNKQVEGRRVRTRKKRRE